MQIYSEVRTAQEEFDGAQEEVDRMQAEFEETFVEKKRLQEETEITKKRMQVCARVCTEIIFFITL
jgi:hypothetical protein